MEKPILLVDDETTLLEGYADIFKEEGYPVVTASNGQQAKELIEKQSFAVIVSDVKMPICDGLQLFHWAKLKKISTPFLFLTGFVDLLSTKELLEMGCAGILNKPTPPRDILEAVSKAIITAEQKAALLEKATETADLSKYARLSIEDFLYGKQIPYPIFIKLSSNKILKVSDSGENLSPERIEKMKEKGLTELWLLADDFKKYSEFANKVKDLVIAKAEVASDKRARLLAHASEVAYEGMRINGFSEEVFRSAEENFKLSLQACAQDAVGTALLEAIENRGPSPYTLASMRSTFATLLAKVMGWTSEKNILLLTMASYLIDIGMLKLPMEIQEKDPESLAPDELKQYMQHPIWSGQAVRQMKTAPPQLATLVEQHHENAFGSGFPKQLTRSELFPMTSIVSMIDAYVYRLSRPAIASEKGIARALKIAQNLNKDKVNAFDRAALLALEVLAAYNNVENAQKAFAKQVSGLGGPGR